MEVDDASASAGRRERRRRRVTRRQIYTKLNQISERLDRIETSMLLAMGDLQKMSEHVDFVNDTFDKVAPISRISGTVTNFLRSAGLLTLAAGQDSASNASGDRDRGVHL